MRKNVCLIVAILLVICLLPGCSNPLVTTSGKNAEEGSAASQMNSADAAAGNGSMEITGEENERIKTLIKDYFSAIYSEPVQNYYSFTVTGKIPDKIRAFISENTIMTAEGNSEMGLHLPRFVETNGLVCIDYSIAMTKDSKGDDTTDIEANLAGKTDGGFLYYTKVNMFARCVSTDNFEKLYTMNKTDNSWKKANENPIDENSIDTIKLQAKYDVKVKKENGNYKLETVKEAVTTNDLKSRLLLFSNDFISRLSFIDYSKTEDEGKYVNELDGKVYEEEKKLVISFFSSLKNSLNIENMKLMQTAWEKSATEFSAFTGKISRTGDNDTSKFNDLMKVKDDYKIKFDFCSMPLQINMERFEGELRDIEVIPHPGYTEKRKIYSVIFSTKVIKKNGSAQGEQAMYQYNYFVTISKQNDQLTIDSIKLNEFSKVNTDKT